MSLNDKMAASGSVSPEKYPFCVLWGERERAPVATVQISWVFLEVLIRGDCLDIYFLISKYGPRADYVPGTARHKAVT